MVTRLLSRKRYVCAALLLLPIIFSLVLFRVHAVDVTTSVSVANTAPDFKAGEFVGESSASEAANPTNEGSSITFQATSQDDNDDDYYLAVCKTDSITAGGGGAPSCATDQELCISTATTDETQASCDFDTTGFSGETQAWYAFVCDAYDCSSSSQGTASSDGTDSPFHVNHRPTYSAVADQGAVDPGQDVTFQATASDSDTDDTADTVKVVVCTGDTTSVTLGSPSTCTGGTLYCESSYTASNPSCTYTQPSVYHDESRTIKGFVFDSHELEASSTQTDTFSPNNVAPTVSNVTLNGGSNITLSADSTVNVILTADITDNNSCQDLKLSNPVLGYLYRSGVTYAGCSAQDNNDCYYEISCSVDGSNTCDSDTDASVKYTCTAAVQFHADPTDANTEFEAQNWLDTIYAEDDDAANDNAEVGTGVEVESLTAMTVTTTIAYGNIAAGSDTGTLTQTTTVTATGNVGLDEQLSGTDMCTDYPTCANNPPTEYLIPVGNQEHAFSGVSYGSGTDLTTSATEYELNCQKTTVTGSKATKDTYWGIAIPTVAGSETYTGRNYITAVKGEYADW